MCEKKSPTSPLRRGEKRERKKKAYRKKKNPSFSGKRKRQRGKSPVTII